MPRSSAPSADRPGRSDTLADHLVVTFEGAFVLTRALDDPTLMRTQLELVRRLVEAIFRLG